MSATPCDESPVVGYLAERRLVEERLGSEAWQRIEKIEAELATMPAQEMPLRHIFTTDLYTREIMIPSGTLLTTRIHLTEHPFVISAGVVSVWDDEAGWLTLAAPHTGVTKPGTRRILYAHTDVLWSTFHVNLDNETNPDKIVERCTYSCGKFKELGAAKDNGGIKL